jgi:hypothetical protein
MGNATTRWKLQMAMQPKMSLKGNNASLTTHIFITPSPSPNSHPND